MHSDRDILLVSIFTFLTVLSWISFELLQTVKTTTVSSEVQQVITPINPKIDLSVLGTLNSRKSYINE
jgi:hypothetical protein